MQLALTDTVRRTGMKVAGAVVAAIGVGFLIAALWTFLAHHLGWGPLGASLAIGLLFVVGGIVVIKTGGAVHHPVPSTDELRAEVETRVSLATDAALEKARLKATEVVDSVEERVYGLVDTVSDRAAHFANQAEAKVYRLARDAEDRVHGLTRGVAGQAAEKLGLTPQFFSEAQDTLERVKGSNAATLPPLFAAFGAGVVLARRLQEWRHRADGRDDDGWDDYDDHYDDVY